MTIPLYPRGFIYSQTDVKLPGDVGHFDRRVTAHGTFWFAPELHHHVTETEGLTVALLGSAHYVSADSSDNNLQSITVRIGNAWNDSGYTGVQEILYDLAGRYGLFVLSSSGSYVYQDAHGMRSVYRNATASLLSSHERLLAEILGASRETSLLSKLPLSLRWSHSKYVGVKSLLPNHRLDLKTGQSERFFGKQANPYVGMTIEQRVSMVHHLWGEQLRVLAQDRKMALSITGGLDSRTSLALARPFWDTIQTFTYTTAPAKGDSRSRTLHMDDVIVKQILDVVNVRHTLLHQSQEIPFNSDELEILGKNSSGSHGRWLLNLYREHISGADVIHLRGNLNETARNYFHDFVDTVNPLEGVRQMMRDEVLRKRPGQIVELDAIMKELELEFELIQLDEIDTSYEPLDLYYWEIRMGRWFSEVFNETDVAFDTTIPFNHRRIIDIALSFTAQERLSGLLFYELINKSAPFLNFFGVNETVNLYEKHVGLARVGGSTNKHVHIGQRISLTNESNATIGTLPFDGTLYIPTAFLKLGHAASADFAMVDIMDSRLRSDIRIQIENTYVSPKGKGYLELVVDLDGKEIARSDLSYWPDPYSISITNVAADSKISVRIKSLRDNPKKSWEMASRTQVEISALRNFDPDRRILTDNPYVTLVNMQ